MKVLYLTTTGASDPTKASLPLHIAANGSVEADQECAVVLAGDATELVSQESAASLEGVGVPPARDLFQKLLDNAVPVYVWKGCAVARGATDEDLEWLKASWITPPEFASMIEQFDRVVSLWAHRGMSFLPPDFEPPVLETERFRLRSLTVHDVVKDYDAVMTSREHLWELFGQAWGWPPADLTLEEDLIDLGWHQKEFQRRSTFAYAVMNLDESRLLGCVYVDPPTKRGYDAEVTWWVRSSELASGLDEELGETVRTWIANAWPFSEVAYPGRDITWSEYKGAP